MAFAALSLAGCGELYSKVFPPSDAELAGRCGASEAELGKTKAEVEKLQPYAQRTVGRCRVFKNEGRGVTIGFIEPPPVQR